jgi:hypothetical protein
MARLTFLFVLVLAAWSFAVAATPAPDAITPDGGLYYGPLVAGKMQGQGRIEWDNGARYEGGFDNGLFSGKGRLQSGAGDTYEGDFVRGLKSGTGRLVMHSGAIYVGEFRDDEFSGQGRYESPDGGIYEGSFEHGLFQGQGQYVDPDHTYVGEFSLGRFSGQGELTYGDGRNYRGAFESSHFQGQGRYTSKDGEVYEGDFDRDEFSGRGIYSRPDGSRHEGAFLHWMPSGYGRYTDPKGNVYSGNFVTGELTGTGIVILKDGSHYEGELKQWMPNGRGLLQLANGDVYKGSFAYGAYEGEGTLTYAKPRPDGRTQDTGIWRYGRLQTGGRDQAARKASVEAALYNQRALLDGALAALTPRDPNKINLYLLAIAGDGNQEVFRREVDFVRDQFDGRFATKGHSLALVNSRNTIASAPMATKTSIREALAGIASRMDKDRDILFVFLTSHGSKEHELTLDQKGMDLDNLPARELGEWLKASGIRWKVVLISACYSGGFVDPVKDDRTLVITAARRDRRSFGCADENDFTDFGRAYFKEALPQSSSFQEAFRKAETLVNEWETRDAKAKSEEDRSLPQMENPPAIEEYLRRWWGQL